MHARAQHASVMQPRDMKFRLHYLQSSYVSGSGEGPLQCYAEQVSSSNEKTGHIMVAHDLGAQEFGKCSAGQFLLGFRM